ETRNVADELNGTAQRLKEITVSNNDLSRDQMASIEETSATMEQMSSSTRAIADQARHQDKLSDQNSTAIANLADLAKRIENLSREASEQGKRTMDYARNGQSELSSTAEIIAGISERSARITEFVTVINDIADKTNLLALNAAIEAARAGEEGRGFSVVADEVGKLAELSSQNAREIGALIRDSSSVTEDGVQSIQRTLEAIEGILKGIKDIAAMNAEVYTLVQDQTQSSSEVNGQMQKIQMFAREMRDATAEQLQGASEILSSVDSLSKGSEEFMQGSEKLVQEGQKLADLSDRLLKRLRTFESSES
ncbi:MAG: hypothetical protein KDK30_09770, partial [Leptospiraceae bacterium]|nr:hypothetical protein [Leptospiraceae bacterium]